MSRQLRQFLINCVVREHASLDWGTSICFDSCAAAYHVHVDYARKEHYQ